MQETEMPVEKNRGRKDKDRISRHEVTEKTSVGNKCMT